tara:strand:+ start:54 stop:410 length:357 start_codon:yes stop_codon:yes gene_type:complete
MNENIKKFFGIEEFNFNEEKQSFIDNLNLLKSMSVEEQTLYKKWQEFNKNEYKMRIHAYKFDVVRASLWKPTDIYDYELTVREDTKKIRTEIRSRGIPIHNWDATAKKPILGVEDEFK